MSGNSRKTERHRLKRKKKKDLHRRRASVSPYLRLGSAGLAERCLVNDNWQDDGMASVQVLVHVPGGGYATVGFLVDTWCAGLKDAWYRLEISMSEFRDANKNHGVNLIDIDLEDVRSLVAGGIRFARQNGFRLPRHYERAVKIIGGVGDIDSADISNFGKDGGLLWCGSMSDLRKRLVGCTFDEFLSRDDVDYVSEFGDEPWYPDDKEEDDEDEQDTTMGEIADSVRERLFNGAVKWCFANNEKPCAYLEDIAGIIVESLMQATCEGGLADDNEMDDDRFAEKGLQNMQRMFSMENPEDVEELTKAMNQFKRYMNSYESPEDMMRDIEL